MKQITIGLAVALIGLLWAPNANATMSITLTNGASTVTVVDGGAGDLCAAVNCVTFSGALGNYLINVSTGIAQNGVNPFLDLNSVNVTTQANAGLLTVETSANGFTAAAPQFDFQVGGTSSLGGASTFAAYGGNSNTLFDTSHQLGSTLSFSSSPFSGQTFSSGGPTVNPYSLTVVGSFNGLTVGSASFDAALNAVPEPASVLLLGVALLFTVTRLRRRSLNRA